MPKIILHKELRKLMIDRGVTQTTLADKADMARADLCAKINGKRPFTMKNMCMIAAALWADPDQVEVLFPEIKEKEKQQ